LVKLDALKGSETSNEKYLGNVKEEGEEGEI